ncbi:MAG: DUF4276 family protein [Phycisphaerales bacterium]
MSFCVASIVEGHGEVRALPILLRSIEPRFIVPPPIRIHRNQISTEDYLSKYIQIAWTNIADNGGNGAILVLADADQDCPAQLGPQILQIVNQVRADAQCAVTIAKHMFEAWLIAGDSPAIPTVQSPEDITNPKAKLREHLGRYKETADQPRLTAAMNLDCARQRSNSFDRLCRIVECWREQA